MRNRVREVINKYKTKCDYLEVRIEDIETLSFGFSDRENSGVKRDYDVGAAIRACHNGGWGFASVNSLDRLEHFVGPVIEQARKVGQTKTALAEIEPVEALIPLNAEKDPRQLSLRNKVELIQKYNDRMLSFHDRIKNSVAHYDEIITKKILGTSEGTLLERHHFDVTCAFRPIACSNGVTQYGYISRGSTNDYNVVLNLENDIDEACQTAVELVSASPVPGGKYPIIVDPHLGGTFAHEAFGHFSEADGYLDNPQFIKTFPLGKKVGSDVISIYDTGLDEGTRGYIPFDDEGVPGEKSELLRQGVLVGRLHNRESAAYFQEPVSGNARAKDYSFPPICRMRNTCIANGTASFEELVEGIDLGVYAIKSIGGHGGEMFSFNALYGYMIRNGKVAEIVRDVSISGNLFTTLLNIDRVGNDFKIEDGSGGCGKGDQFPLPVSSSSPHFRIQEVTVGGVS
ncbi:TldD/PmbA family protein [candidate division CSSED10-310 bacterium]|uniref:TldD/PmbA family protein n=1 Tax=candidate division CSSED10-310 bacterium TaxID=2855610 RepID=A0ABV6Z4T2_UNCC1